MDISSNERLGNYILQLACGKTYALQEIYELTKKILYRIANSWEYQRADIEDSVQDFLEALCEKSKSFKNNENACAWLCGCFVNMLKNKKNHEKVETAFLEKKREEYKAKQRFLDAEYITNHILLNEVRSILNDYERKLYFYKFTCDLSLMEIAEELGKPKSTVQYQVECLQDKIKNFLQENNTKFVR